MIEAEAARVGVDPDLIRAIIYLEKAQGWYGAVAEPVGLAKSLFPMNIRPALWSGIDPSGLDLSDTTQNVRAGALLLKRVRDRLAAPTVRNIGTLYNFIGAEEVSDYGARLEDVYERKLWMKVPDAIADTAEEYDQWSTSRWLDPFWLDPRGRFPSDPAQRRR
jgi:hypothetical protein